MSQDEITLKDLQSEAVTYQALANTQQEFFNLRRSQLNNGAFNRFYTDNRIAVDEKDIRDARCSLTFITRRILKDSLDLLGIGCVEKMQFFKYIYSIS